MRGSRRRDNGLDSRGLGRLVLVLFLVLLSVLSVVLAWRAGVWARLGVVGGDDGLGLVGLLVGRMHGYGQIRGRTYRLVGRRGGGVLGAIRQGEETGGGDGIGRFAPGDDG